MITPFERVVRSDGTKIVTSETLSTKEETKRIAKTVTSRLIGLSSLWALWSFFYRWVSFIPCVYYGVSDAAKRILEYVLGNLLYNSRSRPVLTHLAFLLHVSPSSQPLQRSVD